MRLDGVAVEEKVRIRSVEEDTGYDTPCLVWQGAANGDGYGSVWDADRKTSVAVHRTMYRHLVGEIPTGTEVNHRCGVKRCWKPDHLEAVTHRENMQHAIETGLHLVPREMCRRGHLLTEDNLYGPPGTRWCLTCRRAANRASYHRNKDITP